MARPATTMMLAAAVLAGAACSSTTDDAARPPASTATAFPAAAAPPTTAPATTAPTTTAPTTTVPATPSPTNEELLARIAALPAMPRDVVGLLETGTVTARDLTYASGTPFNDLAYTLFDTSYIEGETSGYDTFLPVDPSDEHPGAHRINVVSAVSHPNVDQAYAGAPGDRIVLGLPETGPFFRSPGDGTDDDYLVIGNFDFAHGHIQLPGSPDDYRLLYADSDQAATAGWYLFHLAPGEVDLIAFVFPCDDPTLVTGSAHDRPDRPMPGASGGRPTRTPEEPLLCNDDRLLALDDPAQFAYSRPVDPIPTLEGQANQIGTPGKEIVNGVTVDANGAVYLFGSGDGNLDGGPDGPANELFVVKLAPDGSTAWEREIATADGGLLFDAVTDDEYLYAVGRTFGALPGFESGGIWDGIILKLRLDTGEVVASDQWGNSGIDGYGAVTLDDAGNLYVSGAGSPPQSRPDPTGAGDPFFLVAKHSTDDLANQWRRLEPVLADGDFVAEAWSGVTYLPGPQPGAGRLLTGGWFRNEPTAADGFLALYGDLGSAEPTRVATEVVSSDGFRADWVFDHDVAPDGSVYVVGGTTGAVDGGRAGGSGDAYIIKFGPGMTDPQFVQIGTPHADVFERVRVAADGTVYAIGYTHGDLFAPNRDPGRRTADIVVVRFDSDLRQLAGTQLGTSGEERAGLALHGDAVVVGGMTEGAIGSASNGSFDPFTVTLDRVTLEVE